MKVQEEMLPSKRAVKDAGFSNPHPNSIMGQALSKGDHETITLILDRAKFADDTLRQMERWAKKGFTELGYED